MSVTINLTTGHRVYSGSDPTSILAKLPSRFSQILRKWAITNPGNPALIFDGTTITYDELWSQTCQAMTRLNLAGVRPGDRVAIIAENSPQGIAYMFAVSELGAWSVPINGRSTQREITSIWDFAECRLRVYCLENSVCCRDHAEAERLDVESGAFGEVCLSEINVTVKNEPTYGDKALDTAVLVCTSGTTGEPKSVMLSHQALMYMGANMAELRNFTSKDCLYNSSPISHVIGLGTVLLTAFSAGGSVEIAPAFVAKDVVDSIHVGRITCITGVPTLFNRLIDYADKEDISLKEGRLRILGTAGAPLTLALKIRIEEAFGLGVYNAYALSECNPIARCRKPVIDNEAGELQPGVEVRLIGSSEMDAPHGEPGEIWVRSPGQMLGYYKNQEATRAVTNKDGFVATGDIGTIDDNGLLRIVGREKDVIIRSGFNVYPAEIEDVIEEVPGVALVAVKGQLVEDNEEVVAFVQPISGFSLSENQIREHCRENLAPYKRPSRIIVSPSLPLSETGKVQKSLLSL